MSSIVSCSAFGQRVRASVRERRSATRARSRRSGFRRHAARRTDPDGPLLAAYQDHLLRVRGLEPRTCEGLLTSGRRILVWLRDNLPDQPLAKMTGEHVLALVQHFLSLTANDFHPIRGNVACSSIPSLPALVRAERPRSCPVRSADTMLALGALAAAAGMGGYSARDRRDRRDDAVRNARPRDHARARHDWSAQQGAPGARTSGYPLANSRSPCAANQGEARTSRAALERSRGGACKLHPACQAEGRQSARVPVVCASTAPIQVPRLNF